MDNFGQSHLKSYVFGRGGNKIVYIYKIQAKLTIVSIARISDFMKFHVFRCLSLCLHSRDFKSHIHPNNDANTGG